MRPAHLYLAMALGLTLAAACLTGPAGARGVSLQAYPNCGPYLKADAKTKTCVAWGEEPPQETCVASTDGTASGTNVGTASLIWGQGTTSSGYKVGGGGAVTSPYDTTPPPQTSPGCGVRATGQGVTKQSSSGSLGSAPAPAPATPGRPPPH